jgi:hypothetical protein
MSFNTQNQVGGEKNPHTKALCTQWKQKSSYEFLLLYFI